jgi:ribose transport system substrate-binding protein
MTNARTKRRAVLASLLSVSLFAAAACGGDDASNDTTQAPVTSGGSATAPDSSDGRPNLSDPYSQQIARSLEIDVDTSAFIAEAPYSVATVVQGPINGWGTIFDVVMNQAILESGKFDAASRIYAPWNGQTENQTRGIDDAIAAGVDIIILTALSRAGLAASVDRATAAGIPVVICMAGVDSDSYTVEVSRDIPLMGYQSAKAVAEHLGGQGKVVMLNGIAGVDAAEFWRSGGLEAFGEYPGIEVVAEQFGNWSVADSLEAIRTVLARESQIDAVWVGGLEMGVGVVNAFAEAGRDVPFIAGTNPINGFLRLAKDNNLEFFAVPFPSAASKQCVQTAIDVLEGKTVRKFIDVIDLIDGAQPYTNADLDQWYVPSLNDDFIGPLVFPESVYIEAGFAR